MKIYKLIFIILSSILTVSCSVKRHSNSGYAGASPPSNYGSSSSQKDSLDSTGASLSDSERLQNLESNLISQQEIKQYYHYKPLLKTDDKRIQFLSQPNISARNAWINNHLFPTEKRDFSPKELDMIAKRDITVGMSYKAVEESWGAPLEKKAAGDQIRSNEMWIYKKLIPTSNGYKSEFRHVYFESGHVAGWETK